ncbi:MAG: PilZ domain-containing protein [candidate division FCPU426 bacterium]
MDSNRKFQRVNVNLSVACRFPGSSTTRGEVSDLSLGGMKVSVPIDQIPSSEELWYDIHLPAPFAHLSGSGKVRWQQADPGQQRLWLGMEFVSLSEEQRKDLEHIIGELEEDN